MRKLLAVVSLFVAVPVLSASLPPMVRVLLPLYLENPVPGAYGSLWQSQFAVHNGSGREYIVKPCALGCLLILYGDEQLLPNETHTALPARYPKPENGAAGAVVYLIDPQGTPADEMALSFQLRIMDLSRSATNAGTEVPVVRESAFRTSKLQLLQVPVDPRFRPLLRLFEMNLDRAEFAVRVFDQATNLLLSEHRLTTSTPLQGGLRFLPGFAQIADLTSSSGTAPQPTHLRVEIEALTAGAAFWAYVSITNNDTQHVTLVTPQ